MNERLNEAIRAAEKLFRPREEDLRLTQEELNYHLGSDNADNHHIAYQICVYECDLAKLLEPFTDEELRSAQPSIAADDELRRRKREAPAYRFTGKLLSEVNAAGIRYTPRFVWNGYLPRGKYTVLAGASGTGKSTLALSIAAAVSAGLPLPGQPEPREPERVAIFSAEDELPKIANHLNARHARPENIALFDVDACEGMTVAGERFSEELHAFRPALIIIDPWQSFTGNARLNVMEDVRKLTSAVRRLVIELDAAAIIVAHMNKGMGNGDGNSRISGSADLVNGARSVLLVEQIDDEAHEGERLGVLICTKSSDCKPPASWIFRIPGTGGVDFLRTSRIDKRAFEIVHDRGKAFARIIREEQFGRNDTVAVADALEAELGEKDRVCVAYSELKKRWPELFQDAQTSRVIEAASAELMRRGIIFKEKRFNLPVVEPGRDGTTATAWRSARGVELRRDWTAQAEHAQFCMPS